MTEQENKKSMGARPETMMNATRRANASNSSKGYFYGNLGDSIERRLPEGGSYLGGGFDGLDGRLGTGTSYLAAGPGTYYGGGLLNGVGRMFSAIHDTNGGFQYMRRFAGNDAWNHQVIAMCTMAYTGYGVIQNIIDLYADFATEGVEIYHPDKSVRNFYRAWAKKVNLEERIHSMFINLFVSANTFVYRRWASLSESDKRSMKRAESSTVINDELYVRLPKKDQSIGANQEGFVDWFLSQRQALTQKTVAKTPPTPTEELMPENKDKRIPWGYTFLNPLQMEVRGSRVEGNNYWVMALDKRDTMSLAKGMGLKGYVDIGATEINLPKKFLDRVNRYQGGSRSAYSAEVKLDKEELSVVQRPGKFDWFSWAVPFVFPALRALSFKDCLRNMEAKACDSVMNALYLFKLGKVEDGFVPEDEHFERFADMLQMPSRVGYLIWNNLVEGEVLQPDVNGIFDPKKHESADRDILQALGIPDVLLGGKGGNFSNSYIAVAGVLEKLESYRKEVMNWLMGELKLISEAMGFQKLPDVRFTQTSLKDDKARQQFLLNLYDRNIISADALLSEVDTNVDVQKAKKEEEKALVKKGGLFERKGPFDRPEPVASKGPKTPNGRPPGTPTGPTGKQSNPRDPKGQGIAELLELNEALQSRAKVWLDQIESYCNENLIKNIAKANPDYARIQHVKQLRKEDRERLEGLIYNIFSHMSPAYESEALKDDFIINMLQSDAAFNIKAEVLNVYTNKIAEYSKTFGKTPSRELRRKFITNAWTQCAIMNIGNYKV